VATFQLIALLEIALLGTVTQWVNLLPVTAAPLETVLGEIATLATVLFIIVIQVAQLAAGDAIPGSETSNIPVLDTSR